MPELPNQIRSDLSDKYNLKKDQIDYLLGNRELLNISGSFVVRTLTIQLNIIIGLV